MKLDIPALLRKPTAENRKPMVYGMYDQRYHNQIGGLTQDARIEVDAAATSWVVIRKTFDHWVTIGRGVMRLRERADQLKGRKTFQRLMEQHGLGELCAPKTKAITTRLERIMQPENLDRVQAWHNNLDPHHRVAWASPSSVLRHCPVFASDKPAKPAGPAMTKPTNRDLARELVAAKAHIAELEAARPDHIEQPAVDLTVARRSYLALVPKPAAEAWAELVTIAKHMGFDLLEAPPRNTTEPHNKELSGKRRR